MKHLVMNARNIYHQGGTDKETGEDGVETIVMGIFVLMEKIYVANGYTGISHAEEMQTIRFCLSPEGCHQLAEQIKQWGDDAIKERERLKFNKKPKAEKKLIADT